MKFNGKMIKKVSSSILLASLCLIANSPRKAFALDIPACDGSIPNGDCMTPGGTYQFEVYSVRLCQNNPYPVGANAPDFSSCFALFNSDTPESISLDLGSVVTISEAGREEVTPGDYNFIGLVLGSRFTTSGSYTSGGTTWRNVGQLLRNNAGGFSYNVTTTAGQPVPEQLQVKSWTGWDIDTNNYLDLNNQFCAGGGSRSRCDVTLNGKTYTGIYTDANLAPTSGLGVQRIFYYQQLNQQVAITGNNGVLDIRVDTSSQVSGNGAEVRIIYGVPFSFTVTYQ